MTQADTADGMGASTAWEVEGTDDGEREPIRESKGEAASEVQGQRSRS